MNDPFLIAIIALGLSVLASAIKLVDWFLHSDPRVLARKMRWVVIALALISVPLLIFLLVKQQWAAAVGLVAVMLLLPALPGRGSLLRQFGFLRPVLDDSPPAGARGTPSEPHAEGADADLVRRSAAILEAYLGRRASPAATDGLTPAAPDRRGPYWLSPGWQGEADGLAGESGGFGSGPMSPGEALEILGLDQGAEDWQISQAHRRLVQKLHPERGGSAYLAIKVTQARDVLLRADAGQLRRLTTDLARKSSR
jgi:hypothetical protein